ncbi:MAG: phosphoribosylformylglycinamidine synthase subunit PurQ [Bacillota bacterium]
MLATFGVVVFPGSNCDSDCYHVIDQVARQPVRYVWHQEQHLGDLDCVILPGGFSYGDYLRTGAIARFSPVMKGVEDFAAGGGLVIGICNGFQVLLEAGLLPGAMLRNKSLRFQCHWSNIRVENANTPFTRAMDKGTVLRVPIAHYEGNYYAPPGTLRELEASGRIVFTYCDEKGEVTPESNPNGSARNIAGLVNETGNVLGMMPHPERCSEGVLGGRDGLGVFISIVRWVQEEVAS